MESACPKTAKKPVRGRLELSYPGAISAAGQDNSKPLALVALGGGDGGFKGELSLERTAPTVVLLGPGEDLEGVGDGERLLEDAGRR